MTLATENSKTISDEKLDAFISSKLPENVKFEIPFVSTDVVLIQLLSLDESKATGLDNISAKFLKLSANYNVNPLTYTFNLS